MAESVTLLAEKREPGGKSAAKKLRKQGLVPGVIYGHKEETLAITLPGTELSRAIRHNIHVLDVKTGNKVE